MTRKEEQTADLIRDLASEFINRESVRTSMITVLRTLISSDLRTAKILVSVFPAEQEKMALDFLKRQRSDFREYLKSHSKLRLIPFIDFDIDIGEKNRQKLQDISPSDN